jgi:hypothetical protein
VSAPDDLSVLAPEALGSVELGEGAAAWRGQVRPLKIGQLPAFARAARPLADRIGGLLAGGVTAEAVLDLIEQDFDRVVELLHVATGAPVEAVKEATLDQALGAVLAVLAANKDFLRGRLAAALRTAATLNPGAGPTP